MKQRAKLNYDYKAYTGRERISVIAVLMVSLVFAAMLMLGFSMNSSGSVDSAVSETVTAYESPE